MELSRVLEGDIEFGGSISNQEIIINIEPSYKLVLQESIEDDIENNSSTPSSSLVSALVSGADAALVSSDAALVSSDAALVSPDAALVRADAALVSSDAALVSADAALVSADAALVRADAALVRADAAPSTILPQASKKLCENILFRILLASLLLIICSPFIICNFYFAETDVSCVNEEAGLGLTFRTLFIIDASLSIAFVSLIGLINDEVYTACSTSIYYLFNFIWLIIECIIFFSFMNGGRSCNHSVYAYIMTSLIMKIIGQGIVVLKFICGSNN
jgi:hypothetical protein